MFSSFNIEKLRADSDYRGHAHDQFLGLAGGKVSMATLMTDLLFQSKDRYWS